MDHSGPACERHPLADSDAGRVYYGRTGVPPELTPEALAAGSPPQPSLNMTFFGGETIPPDFG